MKNTEFRVPSSESKVWAAPLPLACLLFTFAFLLLPWPAAHAQDVALELPTAIPVPTPAATSPWLALIPLLLPLLIAGLKQLTSSIPARYLPLLAASAGLILAGIDYATGALGGNPMAVIFLGVAGTGIREVVNQWKHKLTGAAPVAGLLIAGLCLWGGCKAVTQHGNIVSVTQSVLGLDISQDPSSATPHVRLGYVRSQFHVVPTGSNVYAPAVLSSMAFDGSLGHQEINEEFATGGATRDFTPDSPASVAVKAKIAKTNALTLTRTNTVTRTNELFRWAPETNAPAVAK